VTLLCDLCCAGPTVFRPPVRPSPWRTYHPNVIEPPGDLGGVEDEGFVQHRVPWEGPEAAAAAVLVGVTLLAAGGLGTGIARVEAFGTPFPGLLVVWEAVQFGAQWAGALTAVALLGVLGVCWWQHRGWTEELGDPTTTRTCPTSAATSAVRSSSRPGPRPGSSSPPSGRSQGSSLRWASTGPPRSPVPAEIFDGAQMLAVLVVTGTGTVLAERLRRRSRALASP